jgi:transposase-like protein
MINLQMAILEAGILDLEQTSVTEKNIIFQASWRNTTYFCGQCYKNFKTATLCQSFTEHFTYKTGPEMGYYSNPAA